MEVEGFQSLGCLPKVAQLGGVELPLGFRDLFRQALDLRSAFSWLQM
jgi:hypothetical protein